MKYFLSTICILTTIFMMSCNNGKAGDQNGGGGSGESKSYASAADAANAGKQDLLAAIEKNAISSKIDKEKLRNATPGGPITMKTLDWSALLGLDSATTNPEKISAGEPSTMVPLVNAGEVITMVGIREDKGQFQVGSLGNGQVSTEMDQVMKASGKSSGIRMYEVPNLNAIIYAVALDSNEIYFTSYNGASIRQGMDGRTLIAQLKRDALVFDRQYGDKLKKGKLVR